MSDIHLFQSHEYELLSAAPRNYTPFALALYIRGNAWADKGELDWAIADYDAALVIDSRFVEAYVNRGIAWARKGDLDRAIADYDSALRINPQNTKAIMHYGLALTQKSDPHRRARYS